MTESKEESATRFLVGLVGLVIFCGSISPTKVISLNGPRNQSLADHPSSRGVLIMPFWFLSHMMARRCVDIGKGLNKGGKREGSSLLRRRLGELDTLLDVLLEADNGRLQQLLLLVGDGGQRVNGPLGTVGLRAESAEQYAGSRSYGALCSYPKLNRNREEVGAGLLCNLSATRDAGEVHVRRLNEALGTLLGLEKLLGKAA